MTNFSRVKCAELLDLRLRATGSRNRVRLANELRTYFGAHSAEATEDRFTIRSSRVAPIQPIRTPSSVWGCAVWASAKYPEPPQLSKLPMSNSDYTCHATEIPGVSR